MKDKDSPELTADRDKFDAVLKRLTGMKPKPLETAVLNRKRKNANSQPKTSKD